MHKQLTQRRKGTPYQNDGGKQSEDVAFFASASLLFFPGTQEQLRNKIYSNTILPWDEFFVTRKTKQHAQHTEVSALYLCGTFFVCFCKQPRNTQYMRIQSLIMKRKNKKQSLMRLSTMGLLRPRTHHEKLPLGKQAHTGGISYLFYFRNWKQQEEEEFCLLLIK